MNTRRTGQNGGFIRCVGGALALSFGLAGAGAAFAQQPLPPKVVALRSACHDDYQLYCANVPAGDQAIACLKKNNEKLTAGCKQGLFDFQKQ